MKIAIISDIHGNYEALKSVLAAIDNQGIKDVYCLGDVVGYYSQINECCDALRERNIPCIMGNHDWYFAGGGFCPRSKSVQDCMDYLWTVVRQDNIDWLKTFPVQREVYGVKMVHGGWSDPIDEYLKPTQEYFDKVKGRVFMAGHTHVPVIKNFNEKTYCNPGSVGQPRDGDSRASFATYDGEKFELHRVIYDMQVVFDLMKEAGFNDYYYGGLKTGSKNLRRLAD